MRPPKIDFRFLIYTPKNIYLRKKNMVLNEKITSNFTSFGWIWLGFVKLGYVRLG